MQRIPDSAVTKSISMGAVNAGAPDPYTPVQLDPSKQMSFNVVNATPYAPQPARSNTLLYIGLGSGVILLIIIIIILLTRHSS